MGRLPDELARALAGRGVELRLGTAVTGFRRHGAGPDARWSLRTGPAPDDGDLYGSQLKDVLFERCVLREATISAVKAERVELRGCDLTGLRGAEALRGVRMPWNDVLENAPLFAAVAGIEIVD